MSMIKISPLKEDDIDEAVFILKRAHHLSYDDKETMKTVCEASISKVPIIGDEARDRDFWVMKDEGSIIGAYSLMVFEHDYPDADWLAWYCIDDDKRGQGLGKILLNHAISEARKRKKKSLNLWTTTRPHEQVAQFLYDDFGFEIIKEEAEPDEPGIKRLYRSLAL